MSSSIIHHLVQKGVIIPHPDAVHVGPEVTAENIETDVTLLPGCRVEGAATSIGSGCVIGSEGPAVVINCQLERKVTLGAGYFDSSVFLSGSSMGAGAHVRPGCLLEEQSSGAHSVGLKHTILLPFVTLGSLVNFCDCLMAGGTSRKNHSEVGSSYIHFNFTPHQDKATASLIGDVARGVLLNQRPIFLGGQGGLVGPSRIAYGTVIPAGQIVRQDVLDEGQLVIQSTPHASARAYEQAIYGRINRAVENNLLYIGNLNALRLWYVSVRSAFMSRDSRSAACHAGALRVLDSAIQERIKRLGEMVDKVKESIGRLRGREDAHSVECVRQQQHFISRWPAIRAGLESIGSSNDTFALPENLQATIQSAHAAPDYLAWVTNLDEAATSAVTDWLEAITASALRNWKTE